MWYIWNPVERKWLAETSPLSWTDWKPHARFSDRNTMLGLLWWLKSHGHRVVLRR
jgi:hypothetical protein